MLHSGDSLRDVPAQDIEDETADATAEPQSEDATERTHLPTVGKFNRFWTSYASEREGESDSPNNGGGPPDESDSDVEEGEKNTCPQKSLHCCAGASPQPSFSRLSPRVA